jgi:hypothetical protein
VSDQDNRAVSDGSIPPRITRVQRFQPVADSHEDYHRQAAEFFGSQAPSRPTPAAPSQAELLAQSSQRFAAGTTYGGAAGRSTAPAAPPPSPSVRTARPPVPVRPPAPAPLAPTQPPQSAQYTSPNIARPDATANAYIAAPPAPTPGTNPATEWLAQPGRLKLVAGVLGALTAMALMIAGDQGTKVAGIVLALAVWVICFRQGYHENAALQLRTRLPHDELTRVATDVASALRGPMSSIQFNGTSVGRLDFTVKGLTWKPLDFHVELKSDASGWTQLSTHIDQFTWHRYRVYFIPVPFTKGMDGYGLYKSFGDRLLAVLRDRDPNTTGEFNKRPR